MEGSGQITYGSLSNGALAKLVEVDEELLDADAILGDACLDALLDIILVTQHCGGALVTALMAMGRGTHVLNVVAH